MKVLYKIQALAATVANILREEITKEGIGFDSDCNSECQLLEHSENGVTWVTSMGCYDYSVKDGYCNPFNLCKGECLIEYNGAQRGFQKQNLLPDILKGGVIEMVTGSHGSFIGEDALEQYSEQKSKDRAEVSALLKGDLQSDEVFYAMAGAYAKAVKWGHWRGLRNEDSK